MNSDDLKHWRDGLGMLQRWLGLEDSGDVTDPILCQGNLLDDFSGSFLVLFSMIVRGQHQHTHF